MGRVIDMSGKKIGRVQVIERDITINRKAYWLCKCDCGKTFVTIGTSLRNGDTLSCGCMRIERLNQFNRTHGLKHTRPYAIWNMMKERCYNLNNKSYKNYGERGITVCDKWLSFEGFWEDMHGSYTDSLTIERKDNNGNYELSNCRWATRKEQANNKSNNHIIGYKGNSITIMQLSELLVVNYKALWSAISRHGIEWAVNRYAG